MATSERLAETVQALYAELLEQHVHADAERHSAALPPPGSLVTKTVRGQRYWYLQRAEAGARHQVYLGAESEPLLRWVEAVREARSAAQPDVARRRELVRMLVAAGAPRPDAATGRLLQILAERGLFRTGALVGTHAYAAYANLLGVHLPAQTLRTADVDLLQDPVISIAVDPDAPVADLPAVLREVDPDFLAVPPFDRGQPSTSFKVRGRDLRVDLLAPRRGEGSEVVKLPRLGVAAQTLPYLGYLLADAQPAVVLHTEGVLLRVPDPARFAFHKLWVHRQRPAATQAKARKDVAQSTALLEILLADRPQDLRRAGDALPTGMRSDVRREVQRIDGLEEVAALAGLD